MVVGTRMGVCVVLGTCMEIYVCKSVWWWAYVWRYMYGGLCGGRLIMEVRGQHAGVSSLL